MTDFLAGFGLALVLEGLLWALAPGFAIRMLAQAVKMSDQALRLSGACAVAAGVLLVWAARG